MGLPPLRTLASEQRFSRSLGSVALPYLVLFWATACNDTRPIAPDARTDAVGVPAAGQLSKSTPSAGELSVSTAPAGAMSSASPAASPFAGSVATTSAVVPAMRMLWQNTITGDRSIWLMNGTSWDGSYVLLPQVPTAWSIAGSGDFNADGNADIVWQNTTTGDRSIWFMTGTTWGGAYALLPQVATAWSIAGVGDFNADNKPDLVWQNTTTGDRSIWFMNGSTWNGSYALLPQVATLWRIAAVGDFNADTKPDLVWQHITTGQRSIWFMNGATWNGSYVSLLTVAPEWRIAGAADFDGDADPDLVWQHIGTGARSIWIMTGSTWNGSYVSLPTVSTQWQIAGVLASTLPPPPTTGDVKVYTVTTGGALDPTGYDITICCISGFAATHEIGINTFGGFSNLAPGSYTLTLGGIASNCGTTNNPRTVTVTAGVTTETTFNVACVAATTGSIRVNTVTTGASPDPNGYTLTTTQTINQPIGINASVTIPNFAPGTQSVTLGGLASNCTTTSNPRNVTVTAGATVETTFNVSCPIVEVSTTFYASFDNLLMYNSSTSATANTVFGNSELEVGCNFFYNIFGLGGTICTASIMKFNVQTTIAGKTILEAKLRLYEYLYPGDWIGTFQMAAVATNWNPSTITWNSFQTISYYDTGCGSPTGNCVQNFSAIATTAVPLEFNVTAIVQHWANGTMSNNGFMIWDDFVLEPGYESYQSVGIESIEFYNSLTRRPQLFIRYR